jgi:catechol 2,3-dioxygenase-like lactoylglutathione lyase family enzyme
VAIEGLNHFNIVAPRVLMAETRDFYVDVIGLREGDRPDFGIPGHWLYAGDVAVLHLMEGNPADSVGGNVEVRGTGHLDHIALTATDLPSTEAALVERGVEFSKREFPDFKLAQLFLRDPVGLGIELNFALA